MPALSRNLSLTEAIGLSLAVVAPTLTAAFNVSLAVQKAGAAAPAAFAVGSTLMGLVAVAFIGFSRREAHAGSVYAYVGAVFGPRAGFLAGWMLLLTYLSFVPAMAALSAGFVATALRTLGVETGPAWIALTLAIIALAAGLAVRDVRLAGRLMLSLEGAAVAAIGVLFALILVHAPPPPPAALVPDASPAGLAGLGYASVFAVLSFAGFEGAATLGEETRHPRRDIPLAILGAVVVSGVFFVLSAYCEVRGYGLARLGALGASSAPLDDLALRYASRPFAALLDIAAAISAFAGALGSLTAAARILFAMGRAGLSPALAQVDARHGAPRNAILAASAAAAAAAVLLAPWTAPSDIYARLSTIGVIALILAYLGVAAAQARRSLGEGGRLTPAACLLGAVGLVWCLFATVWPIPAWPDRLWPYLVAIWGAAAVVLERRRPARIQAPDLA